MTMTVAELEQEIRDRINHPRKQHSLLRSSADWNRLCSALDVIGDTELALDAYLEHPALENVGLRYLFVYGVFQLLQTQQDTVGHLCSALGIASTNSPKLPHICDIRSTAVAHPASRTENKASKSGFIQRISLSHHGFTLMTVYSDGKPYDFRKVHIPLLIKEQRDVLEQVLMEVVTKLDEEDMAQKEKHRGEKLSAAFPPTLGYFFEKIHEATHDATYYPLGKMHVELVKASLEQFKQALENRGEWGARVGVSCAYEELEYPLDSLMLFFTDRASSKLNEKDAYIFSRFVQSELKEIEDMAREIDLEYTVSDEPSKVTG